ncbi:MAG: hypothetical protein A2289_08765 [Deltaproteobacteria bacterium RIFOXYA12_FULL_58_15]|nr:MAG: hypothetical protein A2289_08765 [Deltaproteobacteria bacterium RIFOXYA12_FULL_58_15]OGR09330.1 MAG: hypothetical protein A2341_15830 [Deltaproteobacteria bacterium RIFOXYB12_FULL_58_9]
MELATEKEVQQLAEQALNLLGEEWQWDRGSSHPLTWRLFKKAWRDESEYDHAYYTLGGSLDQRAYLVYHSGVRRFPSSVLRFGQPATCLPFFVVLNQSEDGNIEPTHGTHACRALLMWLRHVVSHCAPNDGSLT